MLLILSALGSRSGAKVGPGGHGKGIGTAAAGAVSFRTAASIHDDASELGCASRVGPWGAAPVGIAREHNDSIIALTRKNALFAGSGLSMLFKPDGSASNVADVGILCGAAWPLEDSFVSGEVPSSEGKLARKPIDPHEAAQVKRRTMCQAPSWRRRGWYDRFTCTKVFLASPLF